MTEPVKLTEAQIAARIAKYWRDRGYEVGALEAECNAGNNSKYRAVRSMLVGGLPPKYYTGVKDSLAVLPKKDT